MKNRFGLSALVTATAIALTGCDSAMITGPGATSPDIDAAMAPSLLMDGGFEMGADAWSFCSTDGESELSSDASQGAMALTVSGDACRHQHVAVEAGASYQLTCDAKSNAAAGSTITLTFADRNFALLEPQPVQVTDAEYVAVGVTAVAPADVSVADIRLNSSAGMSVDNCHFSEVDAAQ